MKIVLDTNVLVSGIFFSGDSDLILVSGYADIQVLTPKAFVSEHLRPKGKKGLQ
jgi:predicted nucleic acid-binding protein